ncbi:MAG: HAD hydrolase family protein [Myxococcales bacterium]|nr:HAD hydrolase family protein [Myxococcales bacterium]
MKAIAELTADEARGARYVATDIDDTFTHGGRFTERALGALTRLEGAGIDVLVVTGRSAGFALALATYLPGVVGAVAENGGVVIRDGAPELAEGVRGSPQALRARFRRCHAEIVRRVPAARETPNTFTRLTDFCMYLDGLTDDDHAFIRGRAEAHGLRVARSSIRLHLYEGEYDKASALRAWLARAEGSADPATVVTVGDSANDAAILDARAWPLSVGVRNVEKYLGQMPGEPAYITRAPEAEGFVELVDTLLARRGD